MIQPKPSTSNRITIIVIVVVLCCLCISLLALGGYAYYYFKKNLSGSPTLRVQEQPNQGGTQQPPMALIRPPAASVPTETADTLGRTIVPDSDLYDLACRIKNICGVAHSLHAPANPFKVGDKQKFWVNNQDTQANFQVDTTLRYITPHSYFWSEDGVDAKDQDIKALMDTFENKIYPTDRQFFGTEWTPGVDNDPHVYVLYVRDVGQSVGGYFSSINEYNPLVFKYSNAHEIFIFNADSESLTDEYTFGTLAHEFQHMIHWNLDRNESSWMNEGFSEVASFLNGYSVGGADYSFAQNPDVPLTDWTSLSTDPNITSEHYGESFLFLTYFLDRFGASTTQALVKNQENSLTSVDDTLKTLSITDKRSGKVITADDVVMDWMAALFLNDASVGDGRYVYNNYSSVPKVSATETLDTCPQAAANRSVSQYGADFIEITCPGNHTLSFTGSTEAGVLPTDPHSKKYMFWSNSADQSDTKLTRSFDFSNVTGPLTFSYWSWFDLEKGFDYLYLESSTDGQHWNILKTPSCTTEDKSGNSYGCAYNAESGGGDTARWINETVDLSEYAGKKVQLRFEYVTDEEVLGNGLLLDDLSIPAIQYSSDFESDDGGWQSDGFVRVQNVLPQTFRLELIVKTGGKTSVQNVDVSAEQTADIPISLKTGDSAVLIVTATQRFTRLAAGYTLETK